MHEHAKAGGDARAAALSREDRQQIGREAAAARWRTQRGAEYLRGYLDGYEAMLRRFQRRQDRELEKARAELQRMRDASGPGAGGAEG